MTAKHSFVTGLAFILIWVMPVFAEVPVIDNPLLPPVQRTLSMAEVWRVGDGPDEEFVLGVIGQVISDEAGNIYLLDTQQSEVFKFSPDGKYLKSVSRKGEGPGELGRCYFFGFWDENTIACFSNFPHKFVRFDLEGIPVRTLTPTPGPDQSNDGRMAMSRFIRRDGFLVASGSFFLFEENKRTQKSFLSGFNEEAQETICFSKVPTGYDFSRPILVNEEADFIPHRRWTLGQNGEVYIAPDRTGYFIEALDSERNLLRKITREWPVQKRTASEKEAAKNRYSFGVSGGEMPDISYKISDLAPTIESLSWFDGQLWVIASDQNSGDSKPGSYSVGVFDPEGLLLERRTYQLPIDPDNDQVHWLDRGRAVVVKNFLSAQVASRSSNTTYQTGEGEQDTSFEDDYILEVILYEAVN